jgi:hypothetical protein
MQSRPTFLNLFLFYITSFKNYFVMTTQLTENELLNLANLGYDVTLQNIKSGRIRIDNWQDWDYQLTDKDIEQICSVLGGWERTKNIIANRLRSLKTLPSNWCFDRIHYCRHSKRWAYCAGQDYPSELATIRKWFTNL